MVVGLQNYLATLGDLVTIVIGLIFVLCVSFFRRGVAGELQAWLKRDQPAPKAAAAESEKSNPMTKLSPRSTEA